MRKEITLEEVLGLEDGTVVYVDDTEMFGGKNQKTIKRNGSLVCADGCFYKIRDFGVYKGRLIEFFLAENVEVDKDEENEKGGFIKIDEDEEYWSWGDYEEDEDEEEEVFPLKQKRVKLLLS
ncbi:MAG: hypothetical protein ACRCX8_14310 [Sarcina sp.]